MRKNRINPLTMMSSLVLAGVVALGVISCSKSDSAPIIPNAANFTSAVSSTYKITAPTGIPVAFTNTSTGSKTYLWDFGDNTTDTVKTPTHIYNLPGTYTVKLTTGAATGKLPATAFKSVDVVVTDPTASLTNILQSGNFADATKWTVLYSGQHNGSTFNYAKYTFNSTANLPTGATVGLTVSNDPALAGQEAGTVIYQAINLAAGVYKFDGLIKHDAENRTGTANVALQQYWFETCVGKVKPTFDPTLPAPAGNDNGYNDSDPTPETGPFTAADGTVSSTVPAAISGFIYNAWTGRAASTDYAATNGVMPNVLWGRKARTKADVNGVFTVSSANAGTYYFVIKFGVGGGGGFGADGITVSNFRIVKLQ